VAGHATSDRRCVTPPASGLWPASIRSVATRLWSDPLSRGGLALMANTAVTGVLGFGYWLIAARLFSQYDVGVAGALVAASTLFSGLGQLNLSGMLMRFLPTAEGKSRRLVLLAYGYAASVSALLAAISLVGVKILASPTSPLRLNTLQSTIFVLAVSATAIFTIQDSVLIGLRRAVWVPAENGAFALAKIGMLFVLPVRSAFALFSAWMIPLTLTIPVISAVLFQRFLPPTFRRRRARLLGREMRSKLIRFTIGDATGGLFTQAWMYLLPVVITATLGASVNALYFTSFLFSSTIDQVAINYASPLTVEGALTPVEIAVLIRSTLRHIFVIIFPIVTALVLLCPLLLGAFGDKYVGGAPLLRLLLIACLPKAISTVYYAYCRVERTTYKSALMQAYICIATLLSVVLTARSFGLIGVGIAILVVQTLAGTASYLTLQRKLRIVELRRTQGRHRRQSSGHGRSEVTISLPVLGK
jgi:O-antigen/teichoic acid export membrane protein